MTFTPRDILPEETGGVVINGGLGMKKKRGLIGLTIGKNSELR
jgi:hypothetical protein